MVQDVCSLNGMKGEGTERDKQVSCDRCSMSGICEPIRVGGVELDMAGMFINRHRQIKRGELLYRQGDPLTSIYAICRGSVKLSVAGESEEQEQVMGFRLAGEIVGLTGMYGQVNLSDAQALEESWVCEIGFEQLSSFADEVPKVGRQLMGVMAEELFCDQHQLLLLGKKSAEERLAAFLLSLSRRFEKRGFPGKQYHLAMTRNDIANYLGLAKETVSRLFIRFRDQGLISTEKRCIQLEDVDRLQAMLGGKPPESESAQ